MSDNNGKDSYAKDTMAFSVPEEQKYRPVNHPQGQHSQGQRPQQPWPQGQHPQGQRPQQPRPQGQHPQGQRPQQPRTQGQHPQGQRPQQPRSQGQYPQGQRPQQPRPQGQYPQGQRPQQPRPQGQRPRPQQSPKKSSATRQAVQKPRRKRKSLLKRILLSILSTFLVIFLLYSLISFFVISKIDKVDTGERLTPSHQLYEGSHVRNILLIGNDSRGGDNGRSDSMIILSLNSSTNKLNMLSLMRDTYVNVPGYGGCKLNAAYAYGGPELLMDTIEENFYIKIDDYISINFTSFAGIVDAIGGVEIEISDEEAAAINVLLDSKEGVKLFGKPDKSDYLNGGGTYQLSGKQALCYSRLRKVGNADFERTERQRKVLTEMFKNIGPTSVFSLLGDAFPDLKTNMSTFEMYWLSLRLPFVLGYDVNQLRLPAEGTYWGSTIDGQSVLEIDVDANLDIIETEIYGE